MPQETTATNPKTGERFVLRNGQWLPYGGSDLRTGAGMEEASVRQAHDAPGHNLIERTRGSWGGAPVQTSLTGDTYSPEAAEAAAAGMGALGTGAGLIEAPVATLGALAGGHYGGQWGEGLGKRIAGAPGEKIGGLVGSGLGAVAGFRSGKAPIGLMERILAREAAPAAAEGATGALADRIAAEQQAGRRVRLPEEWTAGDQANAADEVVAQANRPRARTEGMIRAGRGEMPRPTNEELRGSPSLFQQPSPLAQTEQPGGETLEDWITRRPTGGNPNRGVPSPQDPVEAGREQYKRIIKPRQQGEF